MHRHKWSLVSLIGLIAVIPAGTSEPVNHEACPHVQRGETGACCGGHSTVAQARKATPLTWKAPEHWQQARPRPFREATFHPSGDKAVECYVTIVTEDQDSAIDTLNRWREQMGLSQVSNTEAEAGTKVELLGNHAWLLEASGTYTSPLGDSFNDHGLIAVVGSYEESLLIVRMVGPSAQVASERSHFLEFLGSFDDQSST